MKRSLLALLLSWLLAPAAAFAACPAAQGPAGQIVVARRDLLALPLQGSGEVSAAAQTLIQSLKAALGEFVTRELGCARPDIAAMELQQTLTEDAHATGLDNDPEDEGFARDAGNYGYALIFEVRRSAGDAQLLSVAVQFKIECGFDAMLSVFDASGGSFVERLRWQSPPYDKISGALGSFDYRISPKDPGGQWYVLAKSIPPWCSSTWSSLNYAVLRPTATPSAPRVVYHAAPALWWGGDDYGELNADAQDFEVRFHGPSKDHDQLVRPWIEHFTLKGDVVRRVPPVAESAADFVDEWIQEPWQEAVRLTDPKAANSRALHETLRARSGITYRTQRRCESTGRQEVLAQSEDGATSYYFAVTGEADYTLRAATTAGTLCKGTDFAVRR
jgi:hypothetical protein